MTTKISCRGSIGFEVRIDKARRVRAELTECSHLYIDGQNTTEQGVLLGKAAGVLPVVRIRLAGRSRQ